MDFLMVFKINNIFKICISDFMSSIVSEKNIKIKINKC